MDNQRTFDMYHIEYLAEQYERLLNLKQDNVPISKDKLMMMRKAFKSYDKDGNGVLDRNEINDLLINHFREQGVKKKPTKADVDAFFDQLDDDHSGEIEFDEFKEFMTATMHKNLMVPLREYLILKGINVE